MTWDMAIVTLIGFLLSWQLHDEVSPKWKDAVLIVSAVSTGIMVRLAAVLAP